MNSLFLAPQSIVQADPPDQNYHYWTLGTGYVFKIPYPLTVTPGRINNDGTYGGPVGTYGAGTYSLETGDVRFWSFIAQNYPDVYTPVYEEYHFALDNSGLPFPQTWTFQVVLHTAGYRPWAGIANDLWLFGPDLIPLKNFADVQLIRQYQIGTLPSA